MKDNKQILLLELSKKINYDVLKFHFKSKNIGDKRSNNFNEAFSSWEVIIYN